MNEEKSPSRLEILEAIEPFLGPERKKMLQKIVGLLGVLEFAGDLNGAKKCI